MGSGQGHLTRLRIGNASRSKRGAGGVIATNKDRGGLEI